MAGRSACDQCGRPLGPLELVPLLSHVLLTGKCRSCRAPIDPIHYRIELVASIIGAGALFAFPGVAGLVVALLGWLLIPLAVLDWRHLWLPERLVVATAATGLLSAGLANGVPLLDRLVGGIAGFSGLWLVGATYRRLRKRDGLGAGDPKLFGAIGCWVGWTGLPFALLIGSVSLLMFLLLTGRTNDRGEQHPLGTGLAFGALATFIGQSLPA